MDPYTRSVMKSFCFSFGISVIFETHQYGAIHKTETTTYNQIIYLIQRCLVIVGLREVVYYKGN